MSSQTLPLNISNLKEIFIYYIYLEHKYFCKFDKYDSKDETQRPIIFYTNHETDDKQTASINQSISISDTLYWDTLYCTCGVGIANSWFSSERTDSIGK